MASDFFGIGAETFSTLDLGEGGPRRLYLSIVHGWLMLICKFGRRVLWFVFFSLQKILPPTVQTNLGGRNFASCVALGRIFGAIFRNACPPTRAQLRPLRPKAAEQSRAQAGGQRHRLRRNTYPGQCKTRSVSRLQVLANKSGQKKVHAL